MAGPPAPPPPPDDTWWETAPRHERNPAKIPLIATGTILSGIGLITVFAAGVTWLVAWGDSQALDEECSQPSGECYIGTPGGDTYEHVEDLSNASKIMIGVGLPLMFGGLAISIIGGSMRGGHRGPRVHAKSGPTAAALEVTF